jgi:sugar-specific transcriptional regulator TrmB
MTTTPKTTVTYSLEDILERIEDKIDARFEKMDGRFEKMEQRMDERFGNWYRLIKVGKSYGVRL